MDHHETPKQIAGYTPLTRLGSGSFATVYKATLSGPTHSESELPSIAAIKSIVRSKKLTPKVLANLQTEIDILRNTRHPNIVRLYKVSEMQDCVYLILEYCAGGDLQGLIRSRKNGRLGERLCRRLVRDLALGLGFLWERQLVHRDIKPQNLLLTCALPQEDEVENPPREVTSREIEDGGEFTLKIADFGFARHLGGVDLAETMCGSPLYMAPEILLGQKYDAKADLWSVGTVLFEMISGRTPFHGENHMDLLNNIKRKAVRLPPDVRVSKECVALLRILLDRRPATRADFKMFYEAVEKFVALGCNGPKVDPHVSNLNEEMMPLKAQMDLCAITEDDADESEEAEKPCVLRSLTSLNTIQPGPRQGTTQDLVQIVTPPFHPTMAPAPPPNLSVGIQNMMQRQNRPSVFAPLQASPNLSPATTPVGAYFPTLSLGDGGPAASTAKLPTMRIHQREGNNPLIPSEHLNNAKRDSQHSSSSSRETSDSGFVLVEHSGHRSRSGSLTNSPSNSIARAPPSPSKKFYQEGSSQSPSQSCSRMIVNGAMGMLGTSPATGQALVGRMMAGTPNTKSSGMSAAPLSSGKFNVSPRSSLRSGGCLAHIDALVRMLAAAEDIGRRAISVAHLGDVRAYMAIGAYGAQRDESRSSSCSPMELEDDARLSLRDKLTKKTIVEEEEEEDELPFAMTTSMDDGSTDGVSRSPLVGNIMSNLAPLMDNNINDNNPDQSASKVDDLPTVMRIHFHEAILCYVKTLTMLKSAICAAQKVLKDVDEVIRLPSARSSPNANNPYIPLQKRCTGSLGWLGKNYKAIVERSDAAADQIAALDKSSSLQVDIKESLLSVEELIFNHCLKCGYDGTVRQTLGHYDDARSCYRSAGLLAETLLMDPKVENEDRAILERYVHSFMDQIYEVDGVIRNSRASSVDGSSTSGMRRQSSLASNNNM